MEIVPFIPKCEFEIGGNMDFIGKKSPLAHYYLHCVLIFEFPQLWHLGLSVNLKIPHKAHYDGGIWGVSTGKPEVQKTR